MSQVNRGHLAGLLLVDELDGTVAISDLIAQASAAPEREPVDSLLLSAESKSSNYEIERAVYRPDDTSRRPEFADSVFAWAYTRGEALHLMLPSKAADQMRLGMNFGVNDAGPRQDYTGWVPLSTHADPSEVERLRAELKSERLRADAAVGDANEAERKLAEAKALLIDLDDWLDNNDASPGGELEERMYKVLAHATAQPAEVKS